MYVHEERVARPSSHFLIIFKSAPVRCNAMAPLTRRLWLEILLLIPNPWMSNCSVCTARYTAAVIEVPVIDFIFCPISKYNPNIVSEFVVLRIMCFTLRIKALTGQRVSNKASWWMFCALCPFFWLEMFSVAAVHSRNRFFTDIDGSKRLLWCQRTTSFSRNLTVCRRSDSPTCC